MSRAITAQIAPTTRRMRGAPLVSVALLAAAIGSLTLATPQALAQSSYQNPRPATGRAAAAPPPGYWREGAPALDGQQTGYWSHDPYSASRRRGRPTSQYLDDSQSGYSDAYGGGSMQQDVDPRFHRQTVPYDGGQAPGSIVIDTRRKYLYLVQGGRMAIRYGIGVGREGFQWRGSQSVSMKREWPSWRPPAEMRRRRPDLPTFMEGGPDNPLGARALYLGSTLYRIHGTNEPNTIGQNVSSGCIRLTNDDVIDLYTRVRVGARVVVL